MTATFRRYDNRSLFCEDYHKLREFLLRLDDPNYHFGRWDWMITHDWLDASGLPAIGLWEESGDIVAAATYDCALGSAYLLTDSEHHHLYEEMLVHAEKALAKDGDFRVLIKEGDENFQNIAATHGFFPTTKKECDAVYPINLGSISYQLPEGFSITSMADTYDLYKYGQVLWKGFNHEANGEGPFSPDDAKNGSAGFERPNVDLSLKVAVVAPNGDFVSYCGMWYDTRSRSALVEPVATDPAFRMMGLGKVAVLEGIRRCGEQGAERAFVGSSQQFYYNIGFRPYTTHTWWKKK